MATKVSAHAPNLTSYLRRGNDALLDIHQIHTAAPELFEANVAHLPCKLVWLVVVRSELRAIAVFLQRVHSN